MIIPRRLEKKILQAAQVFPVVAVLGPRQSGKTTLVQMTFPNHRYISLEDLEIRRLSKADPRRFLTEYPTDAGIILDEIQHAPELLSYIQTIVDKEKKMGFFILTGSQNILISEGITQTLAGRIAIFTLLPLSIDELNAVTLLPDTIEKAVFNGCYPRIYADNVNPTMLYPNYTYTYVERDVRQIKNIGDLNTFQKFLVLCAGRIGQVLNLTSLGNDCGINHSTARAWLSILEASYIVFLLHPYYQKYGKRLIKAPKLFFLDTGLACSLLRIRSVEELQSHYQRGNLIESFIIADFLKQQHNHAFMPSLYFWRDHTGNEIDCIIDEQPFPVAVEIKASKTVVSDYFKSIEYWRKITEVEDLSRNYIIYGGQEDQPWPQARVLSWKSAGDLITKIT